MRNIFLFLIIAVLALIAAVATGLVDINQIRPAKAPVISTSSDGVTATGGQAPKFEVQTGTVSVGTKPKDVTVKVPSVQVNPPANTAEPVTNAQ
ncbi:MAG: hypothetical protein ABI667_05440 [Sphingomicrobium sp.]